MKQTLGLHRQMLLGTALIGSFLAGYGRPANAGSCVGGPVTYTCSGAPGADPGQSIFAPGTLTVTTSAGFGITTANSRALNLYGTGGVTFTDTNTSTLTGKNFAFRGFNYGSGDLTVTTSGNLTATSIGATGLGAYNHGANLTVYAKGNVYGGQLGVNAVNSGTGDLKVTTLGSVTVGIGTLDGIATSNFGKNTIIDARGSVSGSQAGIQGINWATATGYLSITASNTVTGKRFGILGQNSGQGELKITTSNTVTGTTDEGIFANNSGTNLTIINTAAVSGGLRGILAYNFGSGDLKVTSTGTVTGTTDEGIKAYGSAASSNVIVNAVKVTGGSNGIDATSKGTGNLVITTTGAVTGIGGKGISTTNDGTGTASINVTATSLVQGAVAGVNATSTTGKTTMITNKGVIQNLSATSTSLAIQSSGTVTSVINNALVLGTIRLGNLSDTFTNSLGGTWNTANGTSDFGAGVDTVNNSGLVIAASNAGAAETTTINGLEAFNNNVGGLIRLQDGATGDKMVLAANVAGSGNYVSNGGGLSLDTFLGSDGSPSDLLVIGGNSELGTGATVIAVNHVGGPGALTVSDGIKVVQVDGTSDAGAFILGTPVYAGAYSYKLFQNGVVNPTDGDWYLRSTYLPSVPVEEAYPQILLGLNGLPSLQQRVGNRSWSGPRETVFCKDASKNYKCEVSGEQAGYYAGGGKDNLEGSGLWARIEGNHTSVAGQAASATTSGAGYDANDWKLQAGLDGQLAEGDSGKLIGGLTAHYGTSAAAISSTIGNGAIDTTDYGLGATLTWYGKSGFYLDGQGQYSWYDSDLRSDSLGSIVKGNRGTGYALSLEAGQRLELGHDLNLTPQAQLAYSSVNFDSFTGPAGEKVSLSNGDSLKGRLGLALGHDRLWSDDASDIRRSHVYAIANLYHEFLDGSAVDISGTKLTSTPASWTGELGLGGSYNWSNDAYSLYGQVSAASDLEKLGNSYDLKGTIGFRMGW